MISPTPRFGLYWPKRRAAVDWESTWESVTDMENKAPLLFSPGLSESAHGLPKWMNQLTPHRSDHNL